MFDQVSLWDPIGLGLNQNCTCTTKPLGPKTQDHKWVSTVFSYRGDKGRRYCLQTYGQLDDMVQLFELPTDEILWYVFKIKQIKANKIQIYNLDYFWIPSSNFVCNWIGVCPYGTYTPPPPLATNSSFFSKSRSRSLGQKYWYQQKGLVTRNRCV